MRHPVLASVFPLCVGLIAGAQAFATAARSPADAKFSEGMFEQALPAYQALHKRDPKDVHTLVRLGQLEVYADHLPEAKRDFEAALALDSSNKGAKFGLKDIMDRTGEMAPSR